MIGLSFLESANLNNTIGRGRKSISLTGWFATLDGTQTARGNLMMIAKLR